MVHVQCLQYRPRVDAEVDKLLDLQGMIMATLTSPEAAQQAVEDRQTRQRMWDGLSVSFTETMKGIICIIAFVQEKRSGAVWKISQHRINRAQEPKSVRHKKQPEKYPVAMGKDIGELGDS